MIKMNKTTENEVVTLDRMNESGILDEMKKIDNDKYTYKYIYTQGMTPQPRGIITMTLKNENKNAQECTRKKKTKKESKRHLATHMQSIPPIYTRDRKKVQRRE